MPFRAVFVRSPFFHDTVHILLTIFYRICKALEEYFLKKNISAGLNNLFFYDANPILSRRLTLFSHKII